MSIINTSPDIMGYFIVNGTQSPEWKYIRYRLTPPTYVHLLPIAKLTLKATYNHILSPLELTQGMSS